MSRTVCLLQTKGTLFYFIGFIFFEVHSSFTSKALRLTSRTPVCRLSVLMLRRMNPDSVSRHWFDRTRSGLNSFVKVYRPLSEVPLKTPES